ncbi:hypothetical protein LLEC1_05023 [Akanthomyces lecanii]|uniref:Uncharacterized protein n=1 Tax=Cordyceps confragosa TaxID=2714763 RepID=A0A179IAE2_CORDF|nr:hypothetical protein LLEC1_05023 [Akanthomyces lecanii]
MLPFSTEEVGSGAEGACSVCGHYNSVHRSEACAAKRCRKKIKVCGATDHSVVHMNGDIENNLGGWVVCRPCPDHGRQGRDVDYSECPVVKKDKSGYLVIIQNGVEC